MLGLAFAALSLIQFMKPSNDCFRVTALCWKLAFFSCVNYTHGDLGRNRDNMNSSSLRESLGPAFSPLSPAALLSAEARSPDQTNRAVTISQMNELLQRSHSSPNSNLLFSAADEELMRAKLEIENVSLVHFDSELYEPLYRNVSKFKRFSILSVKSLVVFAWSVHFW